MSRKSIEPTYDEQKTGPRFTVETRLNDRRISHEDITDPFVNATMRIGWRDRLRGLFGGLAVTVVVGGDREIVEDVSELDGGYKGQHDSTRRSEWNARLERALGDFAANLAEHETDLP